MKGLSALGLLGCAAALTFAPAASAAGGAGCKLDATIDFGSTPLKQASGKVKASLTGTLASCQADPGTSGTPASGTIEAGGLWTGPNGHKWVEPKIDINGSCAAATQALWTGTAIVKWAGGGVSVLAVNGGSSLGPAVYISGQSVLASVTLQPVDPLDDPLIISTTQYLGFTRTGAGIMNFAPGDCLAGGVTSSPFTGVLGFYKTS